MACTTILVGKNASYDGSTMIARNDDSGSGHFTAKKFVVIHPEEQLKVYKSVLSHAERRGDYVAKNITGEQDLKLFESGVKYFK